MKLISYARSLHDLSVLKESGVSEVILEPKGLSRFGKLSEEDFITFSKRARELSLRVVLEWDILMTEDIFAQKIVIVEALLPFADALRVQDPGSFHWAVQHANNPLQFLAENGNHNLKALQGWVELSKGKLERIILSLELPRSSLNEYIQNLSVPCELLGFGRILLFYTPRSLLSPLVSERVFQNEELSALGESEESPHKGFPIIENQHGTFMFHIKEFCLLNFASELSNMGLGYFRIDQRWENRLPEVVDLVLNFDQEKFEHFKSSYPQELMRGFYLVNKTDVLFPKLKNSRLQNRDKDYVGEVLESEKGSHLAFMVKNPKGVKITDELKIIHPKGEIIEAKIYSLKNSALEEVSQIDQGKLAVIQFIGGVWVKSQIFYR
jgi:putative protease